MTPPERPEGREDPRCPKCGYTYSDCQIHGDHSLCGEPTPTPEPKREAPRCHCGHSLHEHYMCGDPSKMACYRRDECGCRRYVDSAHSPREKWEVSR